MTREEAISLIKSAQLMLINPTTNEPVSDLYAALDMAIQALSREPISLDDINDALAASFRNGVRSAKVEQEPCDDAISRADVYKLFERFDAIPYSVIAELPSVTPSRRKGHWITKIDDTAHNFPFGKRVECSECGQRFVTGDDVSRNFCPKCGAKMVEPQKSEEISERNMKMWEEIFKAERSDKE